METTTTTQDQDRRYLYTMPDGTQRVFEFYGPHGRIFSCLRVVSRAPYHPDARYTDEDSPEDLETAGREISKEESRNLTGFYLDGGNILGEIQNQLERCRPDDPYAPFCRALLTMVEGRPADEWGR